MVSKPHPVCGECGLVYYRNPLPAVILVVRREDRLLIARRASPPAMGELCLPGGFVDLGESPLDAARRELKEETGLTGGSFRLVASDRDVTDYGSVVLFVYSVDEWHGSPMALDDASELMWMKLEDVPPLAFGAHDRAVEMLKRERM
jgi:8-oxo-dGTP diphosphatase